MREVSETGDDQTPIIVADAGRLSDCMHSEMTVYLFKLKGSCSRL